MAKFILGRIVATPGALAEFERACMVPADLLARHQRGDWGEVCEEDRLANESALREGERLFSVYRLSSGTKIWIITERDRSSTTLLLPSEY